MEQKTVIVTGASRGIGAATAKYFAKHNYYVVATYLSDTEGIKEVISSIAVEGGKASAFQCNIASSEQVKALVTFAKEECGSIDVLINNAGIQLFELVTMTTDDNWHKIIDTNLSSVFYLTREVSKDMVRKKRGSIVNVSSVFGITGASMETAYSASKAGIIGFSKAVAKELAPSSITVNCVAPGVINSSMNSWMSREEKKELTERIPLSRFGTSEEVAEAIYFLAHQRYITGQILCVDGGLV